jgi:truncated hemoglobin YjbI
MEHGQDRTESSAISGELLDDWVTILQSELAGIVLDREMQDVLLRAIDGWAVQSRAMLRMMHPLQEGSGDRHATFAAGPDAAARAAAAAATPDERDAVIRELLERVAELERRIAGGDAAPR